VRLNDVEYLNLSDKEVRAASSPRIVDYPTVEMIEAVIAVMPDVTDIENRNRALVAFGALTAARVGAVISLKRKHFDKRRMLVMQEPREVNTKASKRIDTFLIPVSETIEGVFMDWVAHYDAVLKFGPEDPLFPNTKMGHDNERQFRAIGLRRDHWQTAGPLREIYKVGFEAANLPSYNPHSFRNMLVEEMYQRGLSIAAFKAGSQNLGHESPLTTLMSYGRIPLEEQGRLIREAFTAPPRVTNDKPFTRADFEELLKSMSAA
jgi:integrase